MSVTPRNSNKKFAGRQKTFLSNPPSSRASIIAGAIKHKFHHDFNQRQNSGLSTPLLKAKLAGYSQEELEEYRQVFNVFDTDGSGAIGIDELESAMRNLGLEPQKMSLSK
ncbi:hypothetical protein LOAG_13484 [Loa loa]|uniref:EF-hand domain-containing protein n=1 Tax=Loa loa TaxID=7209 RepID=A0A1S0TKS4_LOALO|nr:hypothetical protein LOAG_13484 [Loa loa]EFO15033.1 hypothetical protein LOAG_13484 [Loa loa]